MFGSQPQKIKLDKTIKVRKVEVEVEEVVITLGTSTNATDNSMILSGGGNENREKNKKQLCTCNTPFFYILCHRYGRLQPETSRNFLVTRFIEEISYVFLFTFFSTAGSHFHLGGPLAFSLILSPPLQNFYLAVPIALFFYLSL